MSKLKKNKTKSKSKSKSTRAKGRKKPQTMPLAIAEPRLRDSRNSRNGPQEAAESLTSGASGKPPQTAPMYEMMLAWSPWSVMLRQQALLAQIGSSMIEAQQEFARQWTAPPRPTDRSS